MKSLARLILVLAAVWLSLGTLTAQAGGSYYFLYTHLRLVYCTKTSTPGYGPYYAYFDVMEEVSYPAGAMLHTVVRVNGAVTVDTTAILPVATVGTFGGERIDSPTPNYTATKTLELYVGGTLRSRTTLKAACSDAVTGTWGPYGNIVEASIF